MQQITMKTKLFFKILLLLICISSNAQKELWGYKVVYNYQTPQSPGVNDGMIVKVPLAGTNQDPEIVYVFDTSGLLGKFPKGRLFQASNGKLYGVTGYGDGYSGGPTAPLGVLFEYDLILNQYRVVDSNTLIDTRFGLIEPIPGFLYGTTNAGNQVFKYNLMTDSISIFGTIPRFFYNSHYYYPKAVGELMKATDGNLYGVTDIAPSNQNIPYPGGIFKLNLNTNIISIPYVFSFTNLGLDVYYPIYGSKLVEGQAGKLYGTAQGGVNVGPNGVAPNGSGTLFEYTIATNSMVKKFDFDYNGIGMSPSPLIYGGNNKLYGTLYSIYLNTYPNSYGSIYEYDVVTNALTVLHVMDPLNDDNQLHPLGIMLKASDDNLYSSSQGNFFKYNLSTNTINSKIAATYSEDTKEFIEICRKPAYHYFDVDTFDTCIGGNFIFDVQNTNATSYQWQKNNTNVAGQTTCILNLTNLQTTDAGNYTCIMTNECGTTTTMVLHLTINCLGTNTVASLEKAIKLYPNPTQNTLNIKLPENIEVNVTGISITNSLGQIVQETKTENTITIDVSHLQTGLYFISLTTNYGIWNGKFVKE